MATHDGRLDDLWERAERIASAHPEELTEMAPEEIRKLVHDLHVHRIELEMQNEELIRTQYELENARTRYASLFNNAPVGYVVLDRSGIIQRANYTFAQMVQEDVLDLQDKAFGGYVDPAHRTVFYSRYRAMFNRPAGKHEDLLIRRGNDRFWARVETLPSPVAREEGEDPEEARELFLTVSDISDQKAVEEALRNSEEHLATTLQSVGDGVITTDINGLVTDLNPVAASIIGYDATEAKGRDIGEVFPIVDSRNGKPVDNPLIRAMRENRVVALSNHTVLRSKSGTEYQIADSAAPIRKPDGRTVGAVLVFRDVTEEYRLSEERRFRSLLLSQIQDLVLATDANGIITYVNEPQSRLLGYEQEELLGRSVEMLEGETTLGPTQHEIIEAAKKHGSWRGLVENRTKTGGKVVLDARIRLVKDEEREVVGMVGVSTDVTERQRILEQLGESEKQKSLLLDSMRELFLYLDLDYRVQWGNRSAEEYLGGPDRRIAGKACYEIWHRRDQPCDECPVRAAMSGSTTSAANLNTPDGKTWDVRAYPIRDDEGEVVGVAEFARDITEIERTRQEQQVLEDQLLQAQKLESIGRLAGGIAHDFNNLLTSISGNTELAGRILNTEHPAAEFLEEIETAADRAARLTGQLLAFSRKQVMQPKPSDPNGLVRGLSAMIERIIGEDLTFRVDCRAEGCIIADAGQVEQVLVNLAVNARDAMPDGGVFLMGTYDAVVTEACSRRLPELRPGAYVALTVHDTGIGMSDGVLEHIFEPFFTTKPMDRGTGLGLATTFGIVKQHGGHIEVTSAEGEGTSFYLFFPRIAAAGAAAGAAASAAAGAAASAAVITETGDPDTVTEAASEYRVEEPAPDAPSIALHSPDHRLEAIAAAMLRARGYKVHCLSVSPADDRPEASVEPAVDLLVTDRDSGSFDVPGGVLRITTDLELPGRVIDDVGKALGRQ